MADTTWKSGVVPGAEALEFRDVARRQRTRLAYLQSIGDNPTDFRIYKTTNGGATWTMEFQNQMPGALLRLLCLLDAAPRGISHSDSVNGVFPDLRTTRWQAFGTNISANMPPAIARRSFVCIERHLRRDPGRAQRMDRHRGRKQWLASRYPATAPTPGTPMTRHWSVSPSAGAFTVAFRERVAWHRGRRRPRPGRS